MIPAPDALILAILQGRLEEVFEERGRLSDGARMGARRALRSEDGR